jgi:hypothetical protein
MNATACRSLRAVSRRVRYDPTTSERAMGFEEFTVNLPGIGTGKWVVNRDQRKAAWEMYVELITRVSILPLAADQGLLREALSSLHIMFGETRRILRDYGPEIARPPKRNHYSFGAIAVEVLNLWLRPFLSTWHPRLVEYEQAHPGHEDQWPHAQALRDDLRLLQFRLNAYADLLAQVCDIPALHGKPAP